MNVLVHALLAVLFLIGLVAAGLGSFGAFNMLLSINGARWWAHATTWAASVAAFAILAAIGSTTPWLFSSRHWGSEVAVQQPQPQQTQHVKLDLPGAFTSEQCAQAVKDGQANGSIFPNVVVVAECS